MKVWVLVSALLLVSGGLAAQSKKAATEREQPLVLTEAIPLEGAKGRFDHFAMGGGKLFVAALGSNAVEVINIGGRTLEHTITGVPYAQGIAFSPETNKLFVASGQGKVYIFDGKSYEPIATVGFPGGADNIRYDPATKRVYVGCTSWAESRNRFNWKSPDRTSTSMSRI
jgi:sugar lactone lactonase YvrE